MRKIIFILSIPFIILGCSLTPTEDRRIVENNNTQLGVRNTRPQVIINNTRINVEIADDPTERAQGLSGTPSLADDEGMLFIFNEPAIQSFWMKDMQIPLDMIWIRDGVVVGISADVPVWENGQITRRSSGEPADTVLEVNAGWAERNGVMIGDALAFSGAFD